MGQEQTLIPCAQTGTKLGHVFFQTESEAIRIYFIAVQGPEAITDNRGTTIS